MDVERILAESGKNRAYAESRINSLLPEYGIAPINDETDLQEEINDTFIRLTVGRLITSQRQGAAASELHALKRDIVIDLIGHERIAADSAWVDLINDIVEPEHPVTFSDDVIAAIVEERRSAGETRQLVQEEIEAFFDGQTPERQQ